MPLSMRLHVSKTSSVKASRKGVSKVMPVHTFHCVKCCRALIWDGIL